MPETRVLVTGGAGFIGSHVVDGLVEKGYDVAVVDDLSTGQRDFVNPRARFYKVDICDADLEGVFREERPQLVSHHAAQISVQASVVDPQKDARINVQGSLNLLEMCRQYGVQKVVYASSGGVLYGEPRYLPCDEEHPVEPLSPYGASKAAVELYLAVYRQAYHLDYTSLRYGNVYGPRQDPQGEAGVVAIFAGRMLRSQECIINGTGEQERDFTYVEDVAQANLLAMERGSGQAYNIGTGYGTSVNRIFTGLARILNYGQQGTHGPPKPGEVFKVILARGRAERELEWRPQVSLDEGLRRTCDYFRSVWVA